MGWIGFLVGRERTHPRSRRFLGPVVVVSEPQKQGRGRDVHVRSCEMTDYAKWDKIAAEISEDEEEEAVETMVEPEVVEPKLKPGEGTRLTSEGVIQGCDRPGNARGNAWSTNKEVEAIKYLDRSNFSWTQKDGHVLVELPLASMGVIHEDGLAVKFSHNSFTLKLTNQEGTVHVLECTRLPCQGIIPEKSHMIVNSRVGKDTDGEYSVTVELKKASKDNWHDLGRITVPKKLPEIAVDNYSWRDEERGVYIYLKIPGVHEVPSKNIKVRFRELSFDFRCEDLDGKNYNFAVTELPMEIVVERCRYTVDGTDGGRVKIYLRKWARTSWRKIQVHR